MTGGPWGEAKAGQCHWSLLIVVAAEGPEKNTHSRKSPTDTDAQVEVGGGGGRVGEPPSALLKRKGEVAEGGPLLNVDGAWPGTIIGGGGAVTAGPKDSNTGAPHCPSLHFHSGGANLLAAAHWERWSRKARLARAAITSIEEEPSQSQAEEEQSASSKQDTAAASANASETVGGDGGNEGQINVDLMEVDEDPTAGVLNSTGAFDSSNSPDAVEKPDANHCDDLLGVDQAILDEHKTESLPAAEEFESEEETFRHPRVLKVRKIGEAVWEYLVHGHGFEPAQWLAYEEVQRLVESDDSDLDSRSKSNNTSVAGSDYDGNSDHPSDEDYGVKKGKRKVPASTPLTALTSEDLSDQPIAALDRLLNSKSLTAELDTLRSERDIVAPLKGRKIALPDVLRQLVERNERNNIDSSFLSFAPLSDERSFLVQVSRLTSVVESVPELLRVHEQLGIVKRMVQWDICRAHLLLYEWFMVTGPGLAQDLVNVHNRSLSDLEDCFPVAYAQEVQKGKQTTRKKQKTATDDQPNTSAIAPSTSEFQQVPADLYGLIKPKKPGAFKLPAIKKVAQKSQALYTAAVECLLKVLSRELVLVHMAPPDDSWMTPQRRAARKKVQDKKPKTSGSVAEELEKVRARIICRGAVLQCLAKVCEGESIFASEGMHEVLMSPTGLVLRKWREDSRFAAAL
ncbi:hypothetical protein R3P38DRAFT_2770982 [Favolaschia claudopus]|uniref:Uncharacterized protein n=1 Tax=Favolaschia claudopus TaxID=2862362 RepID=A0AAW0CGB7_9AGAR